MFSADLSIWRVQLARTLAWALLLGGWVGVGSLAQALSSGPLAAFGTIALWLLALGAFATLIGRMHLHRWALRGLLLCAALLSARALFSALHGGGWAALLPASLAWALAVALASSTVRVCRLAASGRLPSPVRAAAVGAVLAWWCVGDITDLHALGLRLMLGMLAACAVLVVLLPRGAAHGGCRAGLFDCSLPNWSRTGWREPQRWPVLLASLVMLPMMCGLPWMVSLCRSDAVSPQAVLALHFAAMFLPALWIADRPSFERHAANACAALLAFGALAVLVAPGASAWWGLALAHGAAWSVAWAAQLGDRSIRAQAPHTSPLAGAVFNALFALTLGLAVAVFGLSALGGWHVALGTLAALSALAVSIRPPRALLTR